MPLWSTDLLRNPHAVADKRARVQGMFSAIAPSYDLNNRLHSLGLDQHWRTRAVQLAGVKPTDTVVDVACGTGDLSLKFAAGGPKQVVGVDFTFAMLPIASRKSQVVKTEDQPRITRITRMQREDGRDARATSSPCLRASVVSPAFAAGDALRLPLADACADIVSIAFGIRNVADPAGAMREFARILRPGGRLIILEFSLPTNAIVRTLYNLYFRHILPRTATLISRDKTGAYKYLPESVCTFVSPSDMMEMMRSAGFGEVEQHPLTFGVCVCYRGVKR